MSKGSSSSSGKGGGGRRGGAKGGGRISHSDGGKSGGEGNPELGQHDWQSVWRRRGQQSAVAIRVKNAQAVRHPRGWRTGPSFD